MGLKVLRERERERLGVQGFREREKGKERKIGC